MCAGLCVNEAFTSRSHLAVKADRRRTSWDRPRIHVHAFICSAQTHGRVLILASSVITCLSLGESSVLGQDWREASGPSRALMLLQWGPVSYSLLGPHHKSHTFIFTPHCAQTHIFQAAYYASFRDVHALWLYQRLFCVCSVYKYGSETSIMASASNKQRAEKPPIPAFP